jgi:hypothetical protein
MKRTALLAVSLSLMLVPAAVAAGPTIEYTVTSGTAGDNGWYRSTVEVQISVTGATNGTSCLNKLPVVFTKSSDVFDCEARADPFKVTLHLQFKIDTDAPTVTGANPDRSADANGWFNHPVTVSFAGSDPTSGIASCSTASYGGPDAGSATLSGTCRDQAGNVSNPSSYALKYDATPPAVTASAARAADAGGWYKTPVGITFAGTDAMSGVGSCTGSTTYSGPDTPGMTLAGSCVDNAGNSAPGSFALKYDSTAPRLQDVEVAPAGNEVTLTWKQPADTTSVAVTRTPGRKGTAPTEIYKGRAPRVHDSGLKAGVAYRYRLTSLDEAGNQSVAQVTAKLRALYAPAAGKKAHAGTVLRWNADKTATYYNLQLFRGGKKIMSTWPVATNFRLPKTWSYDGRKYRLKRGTYKWFVWPGRGARARAKYGPLLGSSTFVVR